MKVSKFASAVLVASAFLTTLPADAASFGRSSSSSSSSSSRSSSSSSSFSRPSAPAPSKAPVAAPAPAKPSGIGGTSSMGVRKSEVTAPVAQKVEQSRPSTASNSSTATNSSSYSSPSPTYGSVNQPVYVAPAQSSGFGSSFAGALGGSMLGNALFSNHGSGGTTVINNGGGSSGGGGGAVASAATGQVADSSGVYTQQPAVAAQKGYSMWNFIGDLITFVILVALLVGIAWLFYKGYKMVSAYVNRERGVGPKQPFAPTAKFWEIQKAFGAADETKLRTLLGPDLVDEATQNLTPQEVSLSKVSHEVVLNNPREFSVHYTFEDGGEKIDQVWHFEMHDKVWVLNGIETV